MSKINQIQNAIRELSGGAYQKLMDAYLCKRFGFKNITPLGSHTGTDKTTKGTPDSYIYTDSKKFILIAYGTVSAVPYTKIEKDILSCLNEQKTGIMASDIEQIICCHTSTNINPGQYKQLISHFQNTVLIGLGELSLDLSLKYPDLVKDHLAINFDTHQIFDISDFIEYASRNAYSTPLNMPLLCRENDIKKISAILDKERVVMICGKPGTGKTRLALEISELYAKCNDYSIKVIKSNSESIYEDLRTTFSDDKNFLVIVDDADQLLQLNHLLDLCISDNRQYNIKIIMTVRDYAKQRLIQTVRVFLIPVIYSLDPLDDNSIKQILINNLGIKNDAFIKQIQHISKGNVRLAMMAGKCAIEGSFESISNTFDIFDLYFSEIISTLNKKEILTATLIGFFDSFTLDTEAKPIKHAAQQGISFNEFVEISEDLHRKEVVSIFNNLAVKFENQNLRDYLLYYVFFKTKWLTPSYIILNTFPQYSQRIVFAFNTLIKLFNTEENLQYIEKEVKKAWAEIKTQSNDTVFQYVKVFHAIIPDEALLTIKREIDDLPEVHTDFSTYNFEKTSNNHTIRSEIIQLLIGFKYSNRFVEAIQLALYYLERNTKYPMDFYFLFGADWGFDNESHNYKYSQESILVQQIIGYYEKNRTTEIALCLIFCISNCLKYSFSGVETNRDNTISFYEFGLVKCNQVLNIRSKCFNALSVLLSSEIFAGFAKQALLSYPSYFELNDNNKAIFEQDINAFLCNFSDLMDINDFSHCTILQHFSNICEHSGVICPESLLIFKDNHTFMLYQAFKMDYTILYEDFEKADFERKKSIYELSKNTTDEEFNNVWAAIENYAYEASEWDVSKGIALVFEALADKPERFKVVFESYIKHDAPFGNYTNGITQKLIEVFGYKGALELVGNHEFRNKKQWLANIYDCIPESNIDGNIPMFFLEKLTEQKDNEIVYTLSLSTVYRINSLYIGFIIKYLKAMSETCQKSAWSILEFIKFITYDILESEKFVDYFKHNMDVLEESYILAICWKGTFDYHGILLLEIIKKDIKFISTVVQHLLLERYYDSDSRFNIFWDQDNYDELITTTIEAVRIENKPNYYTNPLVKKLLVYENNKSTRRERQDIWISSYILKNNRDTDKMKFIFGILCDLSDKQRKNSLLLFCKCNPSFSTFKEIPLTPTLLSWTGSEVPVLEKRISFLDELINNLEGLDYVEHRAYLTEYIQLIEEEKENVLLREFIEAR